jgi:hypothetical protein
MDDAAAVRAMNRGANYAVARIPSLGSSQWLGGSDCGKLAGKLADASPTGL